MTHTPGPWKFDWDIFDEEEGPVWCIEDVAGTNLVLAKIFADGALGGPSKEESKANAVLIAAAPELLAEAKLFLEALNNEDANYELEDIARLAALVARIEGQS